MDSDDTPDQYFTCDGRLASFQITLPATKRKSNAKGKASKVLAWPHRHLDPEILARAGFYFDPTPEFPDNSVCFLCSRRVGGWEEGDNPFEEHLRLSPHCGWAIVAAIEAGLGDYGLDDPTHPQMIEARKATFGGRWPHEGKRGWKCKTKQLVDAGWKYTPTMESEDMATCTYCQLALDGWEPKDNPMHEHYKRSPHCQFFNLINQYQQAPSKKTGRGKGARTSKASRQSVQSFTTAASDATSLLDHPADYDDSVMTTTSIMTQGGTKRGRAKKTATSRGKKTKSKKDEPIEVLADPPEPQEEAPPPPPPKTTRGRKRTSDAMEDSVAEAPAPKKRAARGRRSNTVDTSVAEQSDVDMAEAVAAPLPKARGKKGQSSKARTTRKASKASTASIASFHEADEHIMDDEELNRQLEADLDRPLSDDENIAADSDSERKKAPAKPKGKKAASKKSAAAAHEETQNDHAMFDPEPAKIDEAAVDAELKALEAEMEIEQPETIQVPKKGRKAGTRKASKQTTKKAQKPAPVEPTPEPEPAPAPVVEAAEVDELAEGHEESIVSNATVINKRTSSTAAPKKRGRPSKKAAEAKAAAEAAEPTGADPITEASPHTEHADFANSGTRSQATAASSPARDEEPSKHLAAHDELQPPSTPDAHISPAPAAKQATISPSQSPQSSDAENRPPSSKPSNTAGSNRVALAPVVSTPMRSSPSKRHVFANLQTNQAWTAVDLDLVFEDVDKENAVGTAKYLRGGADLTSPEKRMSVEEWIYYNAGQAEQKLKHECEAMVTAFEKEGSRAMRALEGLVIE